VIQLAGTSMLAEANQLAQPVLSMVRGNDPRRVVASVMRDCADGPLAHSRHDQ